MSEYERLKAQTDEIIAKKRAKLIEDVMRDIYELPDRTSSEDQPDMLLVTDEELQIILNRHLAEWHID